MRNMRNLGSHFSIAIPPDEEGLVGRECPMTECKGYFKLQPGTGRTGKSLPTHCPYCGHMAASNKFFTKAQIEYAKSIAIQKITGALLKDLKALEFNHRPRGGFGISLSMKVSGSPRPIRFYREKKLETEVVCNNCTLRYTIYGVFGFCPDCGVHNSQQILNKNLELVEKILAVAETQDQQIAKQLIENALEDCVSAFDGFGRETCRVFSSKAAKPEKAAEIRFQNILGARDRVKEQFNVDFAACATVDDWKHVLRAFQKRHLLAHKMGVVDEGYLAATGDSPSMLGRKTSIEASEVHELADQLNKLGGELFQLLQTKQ